MTTADEHRDYSDVDLSNGVNRGRLRHAALRGDRQAKAALDEWRQLQAERQDDRPVRNTSSVTAARDAYLESRRPRRR